MDVRGEDMPGQHGLVVDWGGVLTGALDRAMTSWAEQDVINFDHFRDVMAVWAGSLGPAIGPKEKTGTELGELQVIEEVFQAAPVRQSPVHQLERGEISVSEFERMLADELAVRGSQVKADGLLRRMLAGLESLDPDMIAMVRRARSLGVRTALLSNSWGDHYPEALWDGLFDEIVISGQVGMRKPQPEIFHLTCDRLGLPPDRCVMVDDLPQNVRAAVAVGMIGVLHRSYDETRAELEILLGAALA